MTPSGIELATFRFVALHLNHGATAVPYKSGYYDNNKHCEVNGSFIWSFRNYEQLLLPLT